MSRFLMIVIGVAVVVCGAGALAAHFLDYPMSGGALGGAVGGVIAAMMIPGKGKKTCPRLQHRTAGHPQAHVVQAGAVGRLDLPELRRRGRPSRPRSHSPLNQL